MWHVIHDIKWRGFTWKRAICTDIAVWLEARAIGARMHMLYVVSRL
jgi:hypothetical protein